MYTYSAYNLGITSDLPIPEFIPTSSGGDVFVRLGHPIETNDEETRIDSQEAVISLSNFGRFVIRNGKEIIIHPNLKGESESVRRFVIGTIFGIALYQRGHLVLHASSVEINGEAIAFVGNVGMGKSTIAATMVSKGYNFITDDVCAMVKKNGAYYIAPSYPLIKISQLVADHILEKTDNLHLLTRHEDKFEYQLGDAFVNGPVRVNKCYFLDQQSSSYIERIDPQVALLEILKNSLPTRYGYPGDKAHFTKCVELTRTIPMFYLSRANTPHDIFETVNLIVDHGWHS